MDQIQIVIINGHLHLSGVQLGVDLRMDTKKHMCSKEIGLCAQNILTIMGSVVNIIAGIYTII